MTHSNADSYASVLEHAPVLDGANGQFIAPGRDSASFLANAIEPFMGDPVLNEAGIIDRLTNGSPPALGDGGRALTPEEAERVVHVCQLLRIGQPGVEDVAPPRPQREQRPEEWASASEGLVRVSSLPAIAVTEADFIEHPKQLLDEARRGQRVHIVGENDEVLATLIPAEIQ